MGLFPVAETWGAAGCHLPAQTMTPSNPQNEGSGRTETARVQGRPVYSEGAHVLWLMGQTAMSVGQLLGRGKAESVGFPLGEAPSRGQARSLGSFLGTGSHTVTPQGPGGCCAGTRGLSRVCPPQGHRASILRPLKEPRPCTPDPPPKGGQGQGRGAALTATSGIPSTPQSLNEHGLQAPQVCPWTSLALLLGMAAAEGVGRKWFAEKGSFYCNYLESTS